MVEKTSLHPKGPLPATTERNIFVVGVSGSGKSALTVHMTHLDYDSMGPAVEGFKTSSKEVTQKIHKMRMENTWPDFFCEDESQNPRYLYTFWDTVGLGSTNQPITNILRETESHFEQAPTVHKVFVVIRLERDRPSFYPEIKEMINLVNKFQPEKHNWSLCLTFCDPWDPVVTDEQMKSIVTQYGLEFIPEQNRMSLCFAKLSDVRKEARSIYTSWVKQSILRVHQELQQPIEPFRPASIYHELQKKMKRKAENFYLLLVQVACWPPC